MKGNVEDFILIPVVLFVVVMSWPAWFSVVSDFVPALRDAPGFGNAEGTATADTILGTVEGLFSTFDNVFLLVSVGIGVAVFLSSFFIDSHPGFFVIGLIVWLISMMIVPMLSNTYNDYIVSIARENADFDPAKRMPITTTIIQNFGLYMLGLLGLVGLGLYAKFARGSE